MKDMRLRFSYHPYDEQFSANLVALLQGSRSTTYAGPWPRAKYEWVSGHYPYGTALRIEEMARTLGVPEPSWAVACTDGELHIACGEYGMIVMEVINDQTAPV